MPTLFLATVLACAAQPGLRAAQAAPGDLAGVSAAVRGDVALTSVVSSSVRQVASGEDVLFGDAIATAAESGLQLLLLDQSVFTIGAEARLVVDSFVFDPATGSGELSAELVKGAFRFVSGALSAKDPEQVRLRVPEATIGVRGTIVSALVTESGSYVLLDGPGRGNDAFARRGLVTVSAGGRTVELSRPGFATFVATGVAPLEPFEAPAALRAQLAAALAADPAASARQPAERQAASDHAGDTTADPVGQSGVAAARGLTSLEAERSLDTVTQVALAAEPADPDGRGASGQTGEATASGVADASAAAALIDDLDPILAESLQLGALETLARIDGLNSSAVDHFAGDGSFVLTQRDGQVLADPLVGTSRLSLTIDFGRRLLGDENSGLRVTVGDFTRVADIDGLAFEESVDGLALWIKQDSHDGEAIRDGSILQITGKNGIASEASIKAILAGDGALGTAEVRDAPRLEGPSPGLP